MTAIQYTIMWNTQSRLATNERSFIPCKLVDGIPQWAVRSQWLRPRTIIYGSYCTCDTAVSDNRACWLGARALKWPAKRLPPYEKTAHTHRPQERPKRFNLAKSSWSLPLLFTLYPSDDWGGGLRCRCKVNALYAFDLQSKWSELNYCFWFAPTHRDITICGGIWSKLVHKAREGTSRSRWYERNDKPVKMRFMATGIEICCPTWPLNAYVIQ